jgi:hypothetical protein
LPQVLLLEGGARGDEPADQELEGRHRGRHRRRRTRPRRPAAVDRRGQAREPVEQRGDGRSIAKRVGELGRCHVEHAALDGDGGVAGAHASGHDTRGAHELGDLHDRCPRQRRPRWQLQAFEGTQARIARDHRNAPVAQRRRQAHGNAFAKPRDARVEALQLERHHERGLRLGRRAAGQRGGHHRGNGCRAPVRSPVHAAFTATGTPAR